MFQNNQWLIAEVCATQTPLHHKLIFCSASAVRSTHYHHIAHLLVID